MAMGKKFVGGHWHRRCLLAMTPFAKSPSRSRTHHGLTSAPGGPVEAVHAVDVREERAADVDGGAPEKYAKGGTVCR